MDARKILTGGAACVLLLLAACGGSSAEDTADGESEPTTTQASTTTASETEPALESEELAGFEPRSVVFANIEFTLTGVQVSNQDLRSYASGGEPEIDAEGFYAYLDITAVNQMAATQSAGLEVETYKLLVDGEEIPAADQMSFLSDLTGFLRPTASAESFLAFPVPEGIGLAEAALLIGTPPERRATLPLTGDVPAATFPVEIALTGSAEGVGPTNGGTIEFTVLDATLSEDVPHEHATSPVGHRADDDELFLAVHVRAEKVEGRGADLLGNNAFRLLVDAVPQAPWDSATDPAGSTPTPTVEPGAAVDAWVAFLVPIDAAELALQVGDIEAPGVIPLDGVAAALASEAE